MNNLLFNPSNKVIMETEYFQVRNEIFDLTFKIRSFKRYKENGKFIKGKYVVEYRNLDTFEMTIYIYLCRCANNKDNAFPSYTTIASKVKCSRSKAQEGIENLFSNGFIYKENRYNEKGEYISNAYIINTKLDELKANLDSLYLNKEEQIITEDEINFLKGIPSDNTPIPSDNTPPIPSDNTPIPSDGKEKKQHKKNNSSYKKQNNKQTVVVKEDEIIKVKNLIKNNLTDISLKDATSLANKLKIKSEIIDLDYLQKKIDIVKLYAKKSKVKNLTGVLLTAIEDNWESNNIEVPSTFNNFKQRNYNFKDLEQKLLGWDKY